MDNKKTDQYYIDKIITDLTFIRTHTESLSKSKLEEDEILVDSIMFRLIQVAENSEKLTEKFKKTYPEILVIPISCYEMTGIEEMLTKLNDILKDIPKEDLYPKESFKMYKYEDLKPYSIKRDGNIWIVSGKEIETLLLMTKFNEDEGVLRFARKFKGMGIEDELESLGAKKGDEVQILDYMFTFKD